MTSFSNNQPELSAFSPSVTSATKTWKGIHWIPSPIELPSSSIGTLYLGSGDYKTDGIDLALTEGLNDDGTAARVSRTDIEAGKLYFLPAKLLSESP